MRRCKLRYEAVQIEAGEAVQIEAQAFVPERVNQDPSESHLPTTAWPRQMRAAVRVAQCQLVALAHRVVAVTAARPPTYPTHPMSKGTLPAHCKE